MSGPEAYDLWQKLAKDKDSDVAGALDSYKSVITKSYKDEGYPDDVVKSLVRDDMVNLQGRIAALFSVDGEEEDSGIVRGHTIEDALRFIADERANFEGEEEGDDEEGWDDERDDFNDEGEYNWDNYIPIGQLRLESLKKKLTE